MCLSNFEGIIEPSDREREKELVCARCGRGYVLVHRISGRVMIQCAICQLSVFGPDFDTARTNWEQSKAA